MVASREARITRRELLSGRQLPSRLVFLGANEEPSDANCAECPSDSSAASQISLRMYFRIRARSFQGLHLRRTSTDLGRVLRVDIAPGTCYFQGYDLYQEDGM